MLLARRPKTEIVVRGLVLIFCAIASAAFAQFDTGQPLVPQQELIPINGFPAAAAANYQRWLNYLRIRSQVETPASAGNVNIAPATGAYVSYSLPGTIFELPVVSSPPPFPTIAWEGLSHELVLANDLPWATWGLVGESEGIAYALEDWFLMAVNRAYPSLFPTPFSTATCAAGITDFTNWRNAVFGGAGTTEHPDYYRNSAPDSGSCALFALFVNKTGMNFIALTRAMNADSPKSRAEFLALLDGLVGEIEGVPPSTWFRKNDPLDFGGMSGGTYLGIKGIGGLWTGSAVGDVATFNPGGYEVVLSEWQTSPNGEQLPVATSVTNVCWSMLDAAGGKVVPLQLSNTAAWYIAFPPSTPDNRTGSYLVPVAYTPSDLTACSIDPRLNVTGTIAILDQATTNSLHPGDLVVSVNGPKWGVIPSPGSYRIELIAPLGATLKTWPDDLIIVQNVPKNPDGSFKEVTLKVTFSDGETRIRTFLPDWSQPIWRTIADKDEPTLIPVSGTTALSVERLTFDRRRGRHSGGDRAGRSPLPARERLHGERPVGRDDIAIAGERLLGERHERSGADPGAFHRSVRQEYRRAVRGKNPVLRNSPD